MFGKRIFVAALGVASLIGWGLISVDVVRAWVNAEPLGGFGTFAAALSCLGAACEGANRAWNRFDGLAP